MPASSKSQQRLFGAVHAYNEGKFHGSRAFRKRVAALARHISAEDARHFAETPHEGLPEKKADDLSPAISSRDVAAGHEVAGLLAAWNARKRYRAVRHFAETPRGGLAKQAQVMLRPEQVQELYSRIPPSAYATVMDTVGGMSGSRGYGGHSRRRRSILSRILSGAAVGAAVGGLGAGSFGAYVAHSVASNGNTPPPGGTKAMMLDRGLRIGLWGAGHGAAIGAAIGAGLGIADKLRG